MIFVTRVLNEENLVPELHELDCFAAPSLIEITLRAQGDYFARDEVIAFRLLSKTRSDGVQQLPTILRACDSLHTLTSSLFTIP